MSALATRSRGLFPLDWGSLAWLPIGGPSIRIEEYVDGDTYVVRAELPGVDPQRDVQVAMVDGFLRIRVDRADHRRGKGHSEFHYGSFCRELALPTGARDDAVTATYDRGILDVRIGLGEPRPKGREIPVEVADELARKDGRVRGSA